MLFIFSRKRVFHTEQTFRIWKYVQHFQLNYLNMVKRNSVDTIYKSANSYLTMDRLSPDNHTILYMTCYYLHCRNVFTEYSTKLCSALYEAFTIFYFLLFF